MTVDYLLNAFRNALDIVPDNTSDNESVFCIGTVSIREPEGLDAILEAYTRYIDELLATLPLTPSQYLELLTARAFTYEEYQALWLTHTKPQDYHNHIIYRVLLITEEKERLLFTSSRDKTDESFQAFLQIYTAHNNHFLHSLLYETYD